MDFGFDGFLDKFEQHFGKFLTKLLLLLIGLAITAVCIGIIWQYLVAPVVAFFGVPGRVEAFARIVTIGAAISSGSLFALRIYDRHLSRKVAARGGTRAEIKRRIEATERRLETLRRAQTQAEKYEG